VEVQEIHRVHHQVKETTVELVDTFLVLLRLVVEVEALEQLVAMVVGHLV
jgi:hypothetical protein